MPTVNCPDRDTLRAFDSGELPAESIAGVAAHLEVCPECRSSLAALEPTDDPRLSALGRPAEADACAQEPECRAAVEHATAAFRRSGTPDPAVAQVGPYRLEQELGGGGMGKVFRAEHVLLKKKVAVKLLLGGANATQAAVERFRREREIVGGLAHPNVVEAHDAGEQDGVAYLVMDLIEGQDLQSYVRERGPLPVAEACGLARQAALGLSYLHGRGLVHRDVKPSNLMRTPDGTVQVLDLGLARRREAAAGEDNLTAAGAVIGTPAYLAPEQANATRADIHADLYGLGGTLYYLLTGEGPFAHLSGMVELLAAHALESPPDVRRKRPDVPAGLAGLVNRLLAKKPEDRPPTAAVVAAELERFARGRRGRWPVIVAAAVLLMAAVGLAAYSSRRPRGENPVAPAPGAPAPEPVQVVSLNVRHFVNEPGKGDRPVGLLGKDSFAPRRGDSLTMEAILSRPAYAYVVCFRPDGVEELCFPERDDDPPPLNDRPRYPVADQGVDYGLDEGEGLLVVAVVASSRPLPAYREWHARAGLSPWVRDFPALAAGTVGHMPSATGPMLATSVLLTGPESPWGRKSAPGVVWRSDGQEVEGQSAEDVAGRRARGRTVGGKTAVDRLTAWLRGGPQAEAVAAVGFAVLPNDRP